MVLAWHALEVAGCCQPCLQGLDWFQSSMLQDSDGDCAHSFLEEPCKQQKKKQRSSGSGGGAAKQQPATVLQVGCKGQSTETLCCAVLRASQR